MVYHDDHAMVNQPPHRYGATMEEIAQEMGISLKTVRKLERSAMEKLRKWADENKLDNVKRWLND